MKRILPFLALAIAVPAVLAQISAEEAAARLAERRARIAATQPTEIDELRHSVAWLRLENDLLRRELETNGIAIPAELKAKAVNEPPAKDITVGMTRNQLLGYIERHREIQIAGGILQDNVETIRITITATHYKPLVIHSALGPSPQAESPFHVEKHEVVITDGRVTSYDGW